MRSYHEINNALFSFEGEPFAPVTLPHTWNALDGQDGGNDYRRGTGTYQIRLPDPTPGKRQYIEFQAANHIATVRCNGQTLGSHEGGFSTFRFALTDALQATGNTLEVDVFNGVCHVYPQDADFTFYGGLYRKVTMIEVEDAHFDLMKDGTDAVFVSAFGTGSTRVDIFPVNADGCQVTLELLDAEEQVVSTQAKEASSHTIFETLIKEPHLWQGMEDPYCYRARVSLFREDVLLDQVCVTYGYRSFHVDPERGFFLNGQHTPLHGVCRHQDRLDKGWAISREDHEEDIRIIREIGANTIRLAHYQHDQYFYDLCDREGFAVWAEIPFISALIPGEKARLNTLSQMKELIAQCYNHPSIITWGIGNEITIRGHSEEIYRNLGDLNTLAKQMDPHRPTTIAQLGMLPETDPLVYLTDIQSYNHYFGWYYTVLEDNGPAFDAFHAANPHRAYGISEYGAENILTWHSATPFNHDYTEEYANLYHHHMLKVFATRPYLWATHAWNMFDFAADKRNEGGIKGRNNKGLVTYDRKTKKDVFYLYQAYWTTDPMVYIAGRRFANRAPGERDVTVYTNCEEVTLLLNGKVHATQRATDHAAVFAEVPLCDGENTLTAVTGSAEDTISLWGVPERDTAYDLPDLLSALQAQNWFSEKEDTADYGEDGCNSRMSVSDLLNIPQGYETIQGWAMSRPQISLERKFRFVTQLGTRKTDPAYKAKTFHDTYLVKNLATQEDIALLETLLRGIRRPE